LIESRLKGGGITQESIAEKVFIDIDISKQGMFIKGLSIENPIILYLHGGMPDYFLTKKHPLNLEDQFTLVWWDQRGAGISSKSKFNEKGALDQLIHDTVSVTKYLMKRFKKDKIYLMGHSGGTFLGIHVIRQFPDLYHAYIGISQISYQLKSEIIAHEYMLKEYERMGNFKMLTKLKKIKIDESSKIPKEYYKIRDIAMHKIGIGTMHTMKNIFKDIFLESLLFPEYSLSEKIGLWKGKAKSGISRLWNDIIKTDLSKNKTNFKVPLYFFHGKHDYTCSYPLAKEYFNLISAPVKGFYTFEKSAHSPNFEEPAKMKEILIKDVLNLKTNLSDEKLSIF